MIDLTRRGLRVATISCVAAVALTGAAGIAAAQETPEYPPVAPSVGAAQCIGDIPYLSYQANFPTEFAGEPMTITINNPEGDDIVVTQTLGPDGSVSGNDILWPGASESPPDWPGWILQDDGVWVEGDDGFLWAREGLDVTFEVNPSVSVSVAYPPATSICAGPQNEDTPPADDTPPTTTTTTASGGLPETGAQTVTLALVGGGLLLGGTALVVASRRRGTRAEL